MSPVAGRGAAISGDREGSGYFCRSGVNLANPLGGSLGASGEPVTKMWGRDNHLSDRDIVSHLSGEMRAQDEALVLAHLAACKECRSRRDQLDSVVQQVHHSSLGQDTTPALSQEEARQRLQSRLVHERPESPLCGRAQDWFRISRCWRITSAGALDRENTGEDGP